MIEFNSSFKYDFIEFIKTKQSYSKNCQGRYFRYLKDFDLYVIKQGYNKSVLTQAIVMGWYPQRINESLNLWQHRLVPLRQFGLWSLRKGCNSFIVPSTNTAVWHVSSSLIGPFASRIRKFLATFPQTTSASYSYFTSLAYFDNFCKNKIQNNKSNIKLNKYLVETWYESLSDKTNRLIHNRINALRLFAYWLIDQGEIAYIPTIIKKGNAKKTREFKSCFSNQLNEYIKLKHNSGCNYKTSINILHNFDNHCELRKYNEAFITKEIMEEWAKKRITENFNSQIDRIQKVNSFSKYLRKLGLDSYVIKHKLKKNKPLVHVFSDEEIICLFKQIDNLENSKPWLAYTYPVILRIIYLCGLRINEACNLKVSDFNIEKKTLFVKAGKNNRDRELLLSDGASQLLILFNKKVSNYFINRDWLFIGESRNRHVTAETVRNKFNLAWSRTNLNTIVDKKPTVHCLRHTFIVNTIRKWLEEDYDVNTLYPYLSKYLGHKSIEGTQYYFHFLYCHYSEVLKKMEFTNSMIPEVYNE